MNANWSRRLLRAVDSVVIAVSKLAQADGGGERARVGLARGLHGCPPVVGSPPSGFLPEG